MIKNEKRINLTQIHYVFVYLVVFVHFLFPFFFPLLSLYINIQISFFLNREKCKLSSRIFFFPAKSGPRTSATKKKDWNHVSLYFFKFILTLHWTLSLLCSGWTLVFKAVTGVNSIPANLWFASFSTNEDELRALHPSNNFKQNYKNRIVLKWHSFAPSEVSFRKLFLVFHSLGRIFEINNLCARNDKPFSCSIEFSFHRWFQCCGIIYNELL